MVPKLLKTFPQLKGVKIDYRWTGNFLLTLSRMLPQFGRLDTNIYYMQPAATASPVLILPDV